MAFQRNRVKKINNKIILQADIALLWLCNQQLLLVFPRKLTVFIGIFTPRSVMRAERETVPYDEKFPSEIWKETALRKYIKWEERKIEVNKYRG